MESREAIELVAEKIRMKWVLSLIEVAQARTSFMPPQGTVIAGQVDNLYEFLLWASLISCAILIGGMIYFALKYKRRSDNDKTLITSNS